MDFDLPPQDDPRRLQIRQWISENPDPSAEELHAAGYVVPHWPAPYGIEADPMHQLIIDAELSAAGVRRPDNPIGIGWAAPTILVAGDDEQKARYLDDILTGRAFYCQLFSEPDAGSDLAALSTKAERDGDEYVVNGSKIWTSGGHHASHGILIARTDAEAPKHKGISYFVCPMDAPGLTMTPIIDMTTAHSFNQVFFDDVRIPVENRIGDEGDGWRLAKVTLSNERVSLSSAGSLWGSGPSAQDLLDLLIRDPDGSGGLVDPVLRQRAAALHIESELLRLLRLRSLSARLDGRTPGPEASVQKILADEHGQHVMQLAKDVAGTYGMLSHSGPVGSIPAASRRGATEVNFDTDGTGVEPIWHYGYLFSPALTLGGGTFAIQRNIVAEKVLGLPSDLHH